MRKFQSIRYYSTRKLKLQTVFVHILSKILKVLTNMKFRKLCLSTHLNFLSPHVEYDDKGQRCSDSASSINWKFYSYHNTENKELVKIKNLSPDLVVVKVDALEGVCWQVVVIGQRLEMKPINLESVNRISRRSKGSCPSLVDRAQATNFDQHPKRELMLWLVETASLKIESGKFSSNWTKKCYYYKKCYLNSKLICVS